MKLDLKIGIENYKLQWEILNWKFNWKSELDIKIK